MTTNEERYEYAKEAARNIILACGRSLDEPGMDKTPDRYAEWLTQEFQNCWDVEDFDNGQSEEEYDEIILVRNVSFTALCEHHLLPFSGKAHVGYLPHDKKLSGLSKLARLVTWAAGNLTLQETMTRKIADFLNTQLKPKGVIVIIEATHLCISCRGAKALGSSAATSAVKGIFLSNSASRQEAMMLMLRNGS